MQVTATPSTACAGRRTPGMACMVRKPKLSGLSRLRRLPPAGIMRATETRQTARKPRLTAAPRTAPGARTRDVTPCAQPSSRSTESSQGKHRKPKQQSAKNPRPKSSEGSAVTPPMKVEVEAQLAKLEQAANPWWSTFCGITNGVWLGETAAFAPSTGK